MYKSLHILLSLLPPGWEVNPNGDLYKQLEGLGDELDLIIGDLAELAFLRAPTRTPILNDLEREYGITPASTLDAQRRANLSGIVYASPGTGSAYNLQTILRNAGFDVYVYRNETQIDLATWTAGEAAMASGGENAYAVASAADALITGACASLPITGYVIRDGASESGLTISHADRNQGLFIIGGTATGLYPLRDWHMDYPTAEHWSPSATTLVDKETIIKSGPGRSLKVTNNNTSFSDEDLNLNPDASLIADWPMVNNGGSVYNRAYANQLNDGLMELVGTASWSTFGTAVLNKVGSAYSGSQCLRIQHNILGTTTPGTYQNLSISGKNVRVSGYARSDGTEEPKISLGDPSSGGTVIWAGTDSTNWQFFDVEILSAEDEIYFYFDLQGSAGAAYIEIDNVIVAQKTGTSYDRNTDTLTESNTSNLYDLNGRGLEFVASSSSYAGNLPGISTFTNDCSFSAWIKIDTPPAAYQPILDWAGTQIGINSSGEAVFYDWAGNPQTDTGNNICDGNLHNITVDIATTSKLWVDNVQAAAFVVSGSPSTNIYIGRGLAGTTYLDGYVYSVQLYQTVVPDAHRTDRYTKGLLTYQGQGELGSYAEQLIPDDDQEDTSITITGTAFSDGTSVPALAYQDRSTNVWTLAWIGTQSAGTQSINVTAPNGIKGVRLFAKYIETQSVYFDNIDIVTPLISNASIVEAQKGVFEKLVNKYKPLGTWAITLVEYN